jgi:phosphohistidine phosphatase
MRVYLVRHGEAKPKEVDPERGLTDGGRRDVEAVGRAVSPAAGGIARIWHSGKRRAAETAEILSGLLAEQRRSPVEPRARKGLDPNDPVEPVAAELSGLEQDVAVVGHLPFLDRLAARLLGLQARSAPVLRFEAGAVLCLERSEDGWSILWLVGPDTCSFQPPDTHG